MLIPAMVVALLGATGTWPAPPQAGDTLRMRLVWQVTSGVHPTADSLGELSGLAVDTAGNVYVSDFQAVRIWAFDRAGRSRPPVGRQGEGPGEYQAPTGLGIDRSGRLVVRDVSRVLRFRHDSRPGTLARYDTSFAGPVYSDWRNTRATRFSPANDLFYPGGENVRHRDGTRRIFYYRYSPTGRLLDTALVVPIYPNLPEGTASVRISASSGRMLPGLNMVPFAAIPVWDVTPEGTVISGDGRSYTLHETDADGREVRTFRRPAPAVPIDPRERQDSLRALRTRLDTLPVPIDRVEGMPEAVRRLQLPTTYPAYQAVHVAPDGGIWVRRWPAGGRDESIFDLFTRTGSYRRTVVLPRRIALRPTPWLSESVIVGVVIDPDTGEHGVVRFEVPR
jgi:sugar lactone lactonase YvrE